MVNNEFNLKPPFEAEFPDSETNIPEHAQAYIEQGIITPAMAKLGMYSASVVEIGRPPSSKETEIDELHQQAVDFANKYGGRPDDYDWRFN